MGCIPREGGALLINQARALTWFENIRMWGHSSSRCKKRLKR